MVYDRPEDRFAYLDRAGWQVMLEEVMAPGRRWITAPLERPFGRGINLQITVDDVAPILASLEAAGTPEPLKRPDAQPRKSVAFDLDACRYACFCSHTGSFQFERSRPQQQET